MTATDAPRTRTQRLIELADQVAESPDPPERHRASGPVLLAVVAVLAGLAAAFLVLSMIGGDDEPNAAVATTVDASAADAATATSVATDDAEAAATATTVATPATTAAPVTTEAAPVTTAAPATTAAPDTTLAPEATVAPETTIVAGEAVDPTATTVVPVATEFAEPVRWAEFSGGIVYLRGIVPDQATADEIRDKSAAVVGPDNVVVEYQIVPGAPRPESAPLYVRDSVLFARNSVDINATARGVLDLGVALMTQNPQITIDVQGHTDSDGSDAMNLALSQRRVDVIFGYLVSQGVDPARLTTAAYGETRPIADNATSAGRAANRRVEFTINNLLG